MARGKSVRLLAAIPAKYTPDFMARLDKRTVLGKAVRERHQAVMGDLGGEGALSAVMRGLVRRFVWFEAMIEGFECRAAAGEQIDIGSWTQLTNTWLGIARMLGLERRARRVPSLADLVNAPEPDAAPTASAEPSDETAQPLEAAAASERSP